MSAYFGMALAMRAPAGFPKRFDLVSADDTIVGDAKYLALVGRERTPPAKLMEITGHVWLLERVQAQRRFLVFGNQIEVAQLWLRKYGRIQTPVEFYFLSADGQVGNLRPTE
jgi:hypothetical protein